MPPREPYTLPKDFDKYTAGYASFETKLKVLGGYSIPFAHTGKRQRQRQYGEYYSFPSWKARFSIALHGWVREQGSQLEERARDQQEVILWSSMGMQIQKLVYLMHRELEKKRKGEMGAKVWSLADLFLHFSEGDEGLCKKIGESAHLVSGDLIKEVGEAVKLRAVSKFTRNAKAVLDDADTIEPYVQPLFKTFIGIRGPIGWSIWLSQCAVYFREHECMSQESLAAVHRLCEAGYGRHRADRPKLERLTIEEVLKHLPEPSMLVDITNKPPVNHAHSLGQMSLSRLSHRQRQIYVGNVL